MLLYVNERLEGNCGIHGNGREWEKGVLRGNNDCL